MELGPEMFLVEEMHEKILSFLDIISMMKAMRTCRLWFRIINRNKNKWLNSCMSDISPAILTDLTGMREIPSQRETILYHLCQKLPWLYWKEIYKEYYRCRNIKNKKEQTTFISYYLGHGAVTSLAFKDGAIYSGHEDGMVFRWNDIDVGINNKIMHNCVMKRPVTSLYVTEQDNTVSSLLDGTRHQIVVAVKEWGVCVTHGDNKSRCWDLTRGAVVGCCGNLFVISSNDHSLIYEKYDSNFESAQRIRLKKNGSERATVIAMNKDFILWGDKYGCLYKHTLDLSSKEGQKSIQCLTTFDSAVKQILLKGDNWICVTENSQIHISVNGESLVTYDYYKTFQRDLEYVAWHGAVLATASKYGFIDIYVVDSTSALRNFCLAKSTQVKLDALHINRLAIGDDGTRPVVVAATDHPYIVIIRW